MNKETTKQITATCPACGNHVNHTRVRSNRTIYYECHSCMAYHTADQIAAHAARLAKTN